MPPLQVEFDREEDGRWIADVPELPGVMAYGSTRDEALCKVEVLALRVIAEQIEFGERPALHEPLTFLSA
jgi:predicted RNase H-like HicB family nuclease